MSTIETAPFAVRIRDARIEAKMTQTQLASATGFALRTIQAWEQGTRSPRAMALRALARELDKPLLWFYGEMAA